VSTRHLDLGVGDVHQPGALGAKPAPAKKKTRRKMHLRISHPLHGRLELHLRDDEPRLCRLSMPLDADAADGDAPRWQQIAKCGEFRGHPAGPFALNPAVFADICRNFTEVDGGQVAFDFEHASEMEPTDGAIPTEGAPAQGWIRQLDNRGQAGLWALVEWLEPARTYIKQGKYRHVSPAIRFGAKHPETGKPIGARLTSVALTNKPFLRGMVPVMATDSPAAGDGQTVTLSAYTSNEYLPKLRACLKMGELSTPAEMADCVDRLSDLFDAAGGNASATVQGVDLGSYLLPLRGLMNLPLHHTWEEVFKAVRALIEAAIAEHEVEHHSAEEEDEPPSSRAGAGEMTMADQNNQAEAARLLSDLTTKNTDLSVKLSAAEGRATQAEADLNAATLTIKAHEAELAALRAEVAAAKEVEAKRLASDRDAEVTEAIAVYGKSKGIAAGDKDALVALLTASPDAFRRLYPKVDPAKRLLSTEVAGNRTTEAPVTVVDGGTVPKIDPAKAARLLSQKEGIPLAVAQQKILMSQKKGA